MLRKNLRILVVGAGSPNADMVAEVLNANGFQAAWTDKIRHPDPFRIKKFDLVYGIYLQSCSRYIIVGKLLRKKTLIHFVGSDAYWIAREKSILRRFYWRIVLRLTDIVLYVSPHLQSMVRREGFVLPFPIASSEFQSSQLRIQPDRDVLYYCPGGERNAEIYRISWIIDYAKQHPNEQITILGNVTHPAQYHIDLPNVQVVPDVNRVEMPAFYKRHRKLIRTTTEDGLPRMLSEALLSGLEVEFNGQKVKDIPRERVPQEFANSLERVLISKGIIKSASPS
ncbi:MAG: hypothetical protein ACLPY5_12360 [Candidatus Bathyarchaeia archaeon]